MGRIHLVLTLSLHAVVTIVSGIPFVNVPGSPNDPKYVALLREALMHSGISPDGIQVKQILVKWELYRTAYRATYVNSSGQTCFLKWHVNNIIGTQTPKMPICENVATGTGNNNHPQLVLGPPIEVEIPVNG